MGATYAPQVASVFPVGTTVGAYPASGWPAIQLPPRAGGAPVPAATESHAVASDGRVSFTGLSEGTVYYLGADLGGGAWRFLRLVTNPVSPLAPYDRSQGQAGIVAPSRVGWYPAPQGLTANRALASRFEPSRAMTIALLGFVVSTAAGSDDPIDVGLYDAAGARLVSSGATSGKLNSTGLKTIAVAATLLTPGAAYYAALACGAIGTTAAQLEAATWPVTADSQGFGTALGVVDGVLMDGAHPLPVTFVPAGGTGTTSMMFVRES